MKQLFRSMCMVFVLATTQSNAQQNLNYPGRYMGREEVKTITTPNGAVASSDFAIAPQLIYAQPAIEEVSKGIWVIGGYAIWNCVVIDSEKGLIVVDAGDSEEEGILMRDVIRKNISQKPIIAAIYTHSHYASGAGKMVTPLMLDYLKSPLWQPYSIN
jgi:hypothetical protein